LAVALKKFSATHDRLGNLKLQLDHDVITKFHEPFIHTLTDKIGEASKARRNVQAVRLTYDSSRAALKNAKPDHSEAARVEMEKNEDEFVSAVEAAMTKMKAVCNNGDALRHLSDLCAAQLAYFKASYEAMSELSPELDELQVTQEALAKREQ